MEPYSVKFFEIGFFSLSIICDPFNLCITVVPFYCWAVFYDRDESQFDSSPVGGHLVLIVGIYK